MTAARRQPRAGTIQRYAQPKPGESQGHYVVRCTAPDGSRPLFHLDPGPESPAARKAALKVAAEIAERLWAQGLGKAKRQGRAAEPTNIGPWLTSWVADRKARGYTLTRKNESHYREHIAPALGNPPSHDLAPAGGTGVPPL